MKSTRQAFLVCEAHKPSELGPLTGREPRVLAGTQRAALLSYTATESKLWGLPSGGV